MSVTTPYRAAYDPSGLLLSNFQRFEVSLKGINHLPQVCPYGLFYGHSVEVRRTSDNELMTLDKDYKFVGWEKWVSEETGLDPYAAIDFLDKNSAEKYEVTCQLVGGPEGSPISFISEIKNAIEKAALHPEFDFNLHVKNKPHFYNTGPHKHVLQDMEDLYKLSQKFDDVFNALVTRQPMHQSGMHYQQQIDRLLGLVGRLYNRLNIVSAETGTDNRDRVDQLTDLLANYVRTEDDVVTVEANATVTLSTHNVTEVSTLRGIVSLNTGTHIESVDFIVSSAPGIVPQLREMGYCNTEGKRYLELDVVSSGSSLALISKSSKGGDIKVKYYAVL
ncbi:hypothetical protein CZP2022_276 [Vibrio phage C-ZP2022]|nr:hypothetical protein CZP2022_276 [Vibrio phage C-ZP2022]